MMMINSFENYQVRACVLHNVVLSKAESPRCSTNKALLRGGLCFAKPKEEGIKALATTALYCKQPRGVHLVYFGIGT